MAHRFLHTLVFSSVIALDGCSNSHVSPMEPPDGGMPDAPGFDAVTRFDAGFDARRRFDAGRLTPDAGPPPFDAAHGAGDDTGVAADAGADAGPEEPMDLRFCEVGWQTTKASWCQPLDADDPDSLIICYSSIVCEPVANEAGEIVEVCREWEEGDGGCLLPRED